MTQTGEITAWYSGKQVHGSWMHDAREIEDSLGRTYIASGANILGNWEILVFSDNPELHGQIGCRSDSYTFEMALQDLIVYLNDRAASDAIKQQKKYYGYII